MITVKRVFLVFLVVSTARGLDARPERARTLRGKMYSSKSPSSSSSKTPSYSSSASGQSIRGKMYSSDPYSRSGKGSGGKSKGGKGSGGKMYFSYSPSYAPSISIQPTMMPSEPTFRFASDSLFWKDHNEAARAQGCSLASIRSSEENQEAAELVMKSSTNSEPVFLGGLLSPASVINKKSDADNWLKAFSDNWIWLDGTPWDYENWSKEKQTSDEGKSIVALYATDGSWGNVSSNSNFTALYRCSQDLTKRQIP